MTGLALLIGLPIVLVLAWYHGDRNFQRVTRAELAILTAIFVFGGLLVWRYEITSVTRPTTVFASTAPAAVSPSAWKRIRTRSVRM